MVLSLFGRKDAMLVEKEDSHFEPMEPTTFISLAYLGSSFSYSFLSLVCLLAGEDLVSAGAF
jgi:hypothetical protein